MDMNTVLNTNAGSSNGGSSPTSFEASAETIRPTAAQSLGSTVAQLYTTQMSAPPSAGQGLPSTSSQQTTRSHPPRASSLQALVFDSQPIRKIPSILTIPHFFPPVDLSPPQLTPRRVLSNDDYIKAMNELTSSAQAAETAHNSFVDPLITSSTWGVQGFVHSTRTAPNGNVLRRFSDGKLMNKDMMEFAKQEYHDLVYEYYDLLSIHGRDLCEHHGGYFDVSDCMLRQRDCSNQMRTYMKELHRAGHQVLPAPSNVFLDAERVASEALSAFWRLCYHIENMERDANAAKQDMMTSGALNDDDSDDDDDADDDHHDGGKKDDSTMGDGQTDNDNAVVNTNGTAQQSNA